MMRTRATVARALGDEPTAREMEWRIQLAKTRLRSELWMDDLGRFMFYKNPSGNRRLDGQYQTCIYPVIYDIVDPLDGWTGMRHLRDRLTRVNGEVYLSNDFPDHLVEIFATWGMQAGAAQQPWAAWGLAALGLNNEAWRPLAAISHWVMDDLKRGSWPEVAYDGRLGYFSPPAALFVQATIEAIFGLRVDKPERTLTISPSFPDHWPSANLTLPAFSAEYRRDGDRITYVVHSREPLARRLRWRVAPGNVVSLRANGQPLGFKLSTDYREMPAVEPAPEGRKHVAHGVSRGGASQCYPLSPGGAKDQTGAFLPPLRGSSIRTRRTPTAYAVGYELSPHPGLRQSRKAVMNQDTVQSPASGVS